MLKEHTKLSLGNPKKKYSCFRVSLLFLLFFLHIFFFFLLLRLFDFIRKVMKKKTLLRKSRKRKFHDLMYIFTSINGILNSATVRHCTSKPFHYSCGHYGICCYDKLYVLANSSIPSKLIWWPIYDTLTKKSFGWSSI